MHRRYPIYTFRFCYHKLRGLLCAHPCLRPPLRPISKTKPLYSLSSPSTDIQDTASLSCDSDPELTSSSSEFSTDLPAASCAALMFSMSVKIRFGSGTTFLLFEGLKRSTVASSSSTLRSKIAKRKSFWSKAFSTFLNSILSVGVALP